MSSTNLSHVPYDAIIAICEFLQMSSLFRFGHVSSVFHRIVKGEFGERILMMQATQGLRSGIGASIYLTPSPGAMPLFSGALSYMVNYLGTLPGGTVIVSVKQTLLWCGPDGIMNVWRPLARVVFSDTVGAVAIETATPGTFDICHPREAMARGQIVCLDGEALLDFGLTMYAVRSKPRRSKPRDSDTVEVKVYSTAENTFWLLGGCHLVLATYMGSPTTHVCVMSKETQLVTVLILKEDGRIPECVAKFSFGDQFRFGFRAFQDKEARVVSVRCVGLDVHFVLTDISGDTCFLRVAHGAQRCDCTLRQWGTVMALRLGQDVIGFDSSGIVLMDGATGKMVLRARFASMERGKNVPVAFDPSGGMVVMKYHSLVIIMCFQRVLPKK